MIDRTLAPEIKTTEKPGLIKPEKVLLDNGLPVYLLQAGTQDVCKIDFIFEAGSWYQYMPLQAALSNAMLQEGSTNYSAAQIAEAFDFHGAYLQLMADQHYGIVSIISLTKHLPKLLAVTEDFIKQASFPEKEFETLLKQRKQRFLLENEKVKVLCQKKFSEVLFGNGHPYAQTIKASDFDSINRELLFRFYREFYHAGQCEIHVSGRFDAAVTDLLNLHFGGKDWLKQKVEKGSFKTASANEKIVRVSKPDAIQSAIRIGKILVKKDHPDYLPLQILVNILGGYFSSRLMNNIREEKGYTYGIGSSFFSLNEEGYLAIATEVDKKFVQATIDEVFHEINILRNELIGEEELERVRQYLLGEFVRDLDGPFALEQAFRNVHDFGLDYDFYDKYYQALLETTSEQLQQLAIKYFDPDSFYTVIAGAEK